MSKLFLGIDTSNYTTSAAIYGQGVEINKRKLLPVKEGEIGLRQSDAVFHHVRQLSEVYNSAIEDLLVSGHKPEEISAIGVSFAPRNVEGSYMPCFLVGKMLAENIAGTLRVPVYYFSHQQGHIAAALYSCNKLQLLNDEFIAYHLSGGTSEGLFVSPDKDGLPDPKIVCSSLDLKAGQAIDRISVSLGLPFPAGKYLDELATSSTARYKIKPYLSGADFSLSGVQNKCEKMIADGCEKADIARYCLEYIVKAIESSLSSVRSVYGDRPVVFSGGVSSNSLLRERLKDKVFFARPEFSCDNAFGTAVLAAYKYGGDAISPSGVL